MDYIKDPVGIETKSFEIITDELHVDIEDEAIASVIKRVIHTTGDFEYADLMEYSADAVESGVQALKEGAFIYADTQMIQSGVNKRNLSLFGGEVVNFVHDEDVFAMAAERKITRSMASIEKAAVDTRIKIYAIGNAPTALFKLKELMDEGKIAKPSLIIGVPVGFVGAAESKEIVRDFGVPYIIVRGRKGGSPVAAAIINALLLLAKK